MAAVEGVMHGLYLLWWVQEKQLSPALVAAILAAGDLCVLALELPTGWVADRFGHRRSLIAGSAIQVAGMLWCWLGAGASGLIVATVLIAVGDAFRSGADQALLYRSCVALDREDAFQTIEARTNALEVCALVGLVLAGGVAVRTWGFAAGWLAEIALSAIGLAIACAMIEPPRADTAGEDRPAGEGGTLLSMTMALLILPPASVVAAAVAASFLAQTSGMTDPTVLAAVVAAITLAEAAGSFAAMRVTAAGARVQMMIAAAGAALMAMALLRPATLSFAAAGLSFLMGLAEPLRDGAIQRLTGDGTRARAASLASACSMACSTLLLPLAGVWRSRRAS